VGSGPADDAPKKSDLRDLRRWYKTGGKFGKPIPEIDLYEMAIDHFHCNPDELRHWDLYDLSRVRLVLQARREAARELAKEKEKNAAKS
jgi:hypothetical protein